eukprot:c11976_g1_i2.p1 GENE.c11976_g1_i2~~c11976_g1_i2.p1  ORF type:complete len:751 (-),score=151.90 c11976_g1_i2:251-2503(-)
MNDKQDQLDEILALKMIFGDQRVVERGNEVELFVEMDLDREINLRGLLFDENASVGATPSRKQKNDSTTWKVECGGLTSFSADDLLKLFSVKGIQSFDPLVVVDETTSSHRATIAFYSKYDAEVAISILNSSSLHGAQLIATLADTNSLSSTTTTTNDTATQSTSILPAFSTLAISSSAPRSPRSPQSPRTPQTWICEICTVENSASSSMCVACSQTSKVTFVQPGNASSSGSNVDELNLTTAEQTALQILDQQEQERSQLFDADGFTHPHLLIQPDVSCAGAPHGLVWSVPIQLQYLPAIRLTATLPLSYPSTLPPVFTLTCDWLSANQITGISKQLHQVWASQVGSPVLFAWMDAISSYITSNILTSSPSTVLSLPPFTTTTSSSSSSSSSMPQATPSSELATHEPLLLYLIRYNRLRQREQYNMQIVQCPVCLCDNNGFEMCHLGGCSHLMCRPCLLRFCHVHVDDGQVLNIVCPECNHRVAPHVIRDVLGSHSQVNRYDNMLLMRTLEHIPGMTYCPRCDENGVETTVTPLESATDVGVCAKCHFVFCMRCRFAYHPSESCITADEAISKFEKKAARVHVSQRDLVRRAHDQVQAQRSLVFIARISVPCPVCHQAVCKTEGCNKMTCVCGTLFCYQCGIQVTGYDHFGSEACKLFEDNEIARIRRQEQQQTPARRVAVGDVLAGFGFGAFSTCPMCRAQNYKFNKNNHITCFGCGHHYCHLCGVVLRRGDSVKHFGTTGNRCRQHS